MNDMWITADFSAFYRSEQFADVLIQIVEDSLPAASLDEALASVSLASPGLAQSASKVLDTFPGHRMVLWHGCEFVRAKLDNWSITASEAVTKITVRDSAEPLAPRHAAASAVQPTITLAVPKGQLQVGQLLVRCFYAAGSPNFRIDQLPQQQILQLLVLADRYNAVPVAMAAAAALGSLKPEDMQWCVLVRLHELQHELHTLRVLPGYSAAMATASRKLHDSLGDLELVWRYEEVAQLMQQLPFCLLHQLLADKRTRAASEDSVVYTIDRWLKHQQQAAAAVANGASNEALAEYREGVLQQQIEQLLQVTRLPQCSQLFLTTVAPNAKWLMQHISAAELATAASLAQQSATPAAGTISRFSSAVQDALQQYSSVLLRREAWGLPRRPVSAVDTMVIELVIPLQQLRQMVEGRLQQLQATQPLQSAPGVELYPTAAAVPLAESGAANAGAGASGTAAAANTAGGSIKSEPQVWQGRGFYTKVQLSASRRLTVSLCMQSMLADAEETRDAVMGANTKERELAVVQCSLCAIRFGIQEVCRKGDRLRIIAAGDKGYTWTDFFGLGDTHSWQTIKGGLISKHQLAVGNDSIVLRARISSIC